MKHHISYFENEQECLRTLISIHIPGGKIDCDPMFFKGNFYKEIPVPEHICDITPVVNGCPAGDARQLDLPDDSINSIILDPPFLFEKRKRKQNYYSALTHTILPGFEAVEELYKGILAEAYRVLRKNGVLIFKCQDYTDSKTTMTHCFVWQWAQQLGFYAKDLAILNVHTHKIYNGNTTQRHLRKVHTYFWVMEKKAQRGTATAVLGVRSDEDCTH